MRSVLLATAVLCAVGGGLATAQSGLAEAESYRRSSSVTEARVLMEQGDAAYEAADYEEAVEAYRGAVDLIPSNAPAAREQRAAAIQRFSQASVERARELRRLGDIDKAREVVDAVLADGIAPNDIAALTMREQLDDPIRTNPASTIEHTEDIEEVRMLLYKALGAYDLGKFDEAEAVYEEVLRVDPTNTAARRGMERVAAAKSDYARAAYDHTRAEMLSMVDGAWELQPPMLHDIEVGFGTEGGPATGISYVDKLSTLRLPLVALEDASLAEALDYLRAQSVELDEFESDPALKGVNIVLNLAGVEEATAAEIRAKRISLTLRDVPLGQVIDYICEASGTVKVEQPYALVIRPAGMDSADLVVRTFRVPPDFLTSGGGGDSGAVASNDPFAAEEEGGGLLAKRLTAKEVLSGRGVSFPEGSSATFSPGNSTLRVRNTPSNLSLVEQIVDAMSGEEPAMVEVEVRVIRTEQTRLEELSFDWLLGEFGFGNAEGGVPGRNQMYFTGGTQGNGGSLSDVPSAMFFPNPVTSGNRSGDEALPLGSIDSLIAQNSTGFTGTPLRAPGVLAVNGLLDRSAVTMLMRGLDQKKGVDLAVAPSVTTRSGQSASVRVTREFIYPTEYEPPELPNNVGTGDSFLLIGPGGLLGGTTPSGGSFPVTPSTPTSFEMREVGTTLEVLPTVSADRHFVDISLKPEVVDFDGFLNYGTPILSGGSSPAVVVPGIGALGGSVPQIVTPNEILMPVFSTLRTETALTVTDNSTIVIAGLLEERTTRVEDKTPVLGDLPVVGRLFQSQVSAPTKTAVVFLVHVRVVDAAGRPFHP